jgi:hypothetical protein
MAVKARFKCDHIIPGDSEAESSKTIYMSPVTTGPGNESYSKWTPSGGLNMCITNPDAFSQFEAGKVYDILITPTVEEKVDA